MRSHVPCLDASSLFPFSNASASLPRNDNSSCIQNSLLHFPFLPPDYSSLLPCVDIHNPGFFDEIESLDSSNMNSAIQTSSCNGYNQDRSIDCNNIVDDSRTFTNVVSSGSNDTSCCDLPSPLSLKPFTERRMRNKGRVPRKNCPRMISPISTKGFSEVSSRWSSRRRAGSCSHRKKRMVQECPNSPGLRLLFKKELRNSDVSSLGRVIIPKREAESNLPILTCKEGIRIQIKDMASAQIWTMRYRYWPNNKSRMYVLQNTRDFVCMYRLKTGDTISLYRDDETGRYFISASKAEDFMASFMSNGNVDATEEDEQDPLVMDDLSGSSNGGCGCEDDIAVVMCEHSQEIVKENDDCKTISGNSCTTSADFFHEYKLSSLESFDSINDCDLSFCEMEEINVVT